MSTFRSVAIRCDYVEDDVRCPLTFEITYETHQPTTEGVRSQAFRHGWLRRGGVDMCPLHKGEPA